MPVDLRDLFLHLQEQLTARLQSNRAILDHPLAKGLATEENWREMLGEYLPNRYCVSKAFVIDADGAQSQEIDLVVYDRQYSPFLFKQDGAIFIPAESVYAVFEVKQALSAETVKYACEKAASVRVLRRTSVGITHAGGTYPPRLRHAHSSPSSPAWSALRAPGIPQWAIASWPCSKKALRRAGWISFARSAMDRPRCRIRKTASTWMPALRTPP